MRSSSSACGRAAPRKVGECKRCGGARQGAEVCVRRGRAAEMRRGCKATHRGGWILTSSREIIATKSGSNSSTFPTFTWVDLGERVIAGLLLLELLFCGFSPPRAVIAVIASGQNYLSNYSDQCSSTSR